MICNSLQEVRDNIDRIDSAIIALIAERGGYVAQAAAFKKDEDGVQDHGRVEKVIQKVRDKAKSLGADPDMVEKIYRQMIASFIKKEMAIFKQCDANYLINNISLIHTTPMGAERISQNIGLSANADPVAYCIQKIQSPLCRIARNGKNFYCDVEGITITVNAKSFPIIPAHQNK
ncbi:MAG: DUF3781 domain-containing protein [Bacteroidales bacterium]|nr:DUF3781 domain-containing protein [Bacteroidales bacterium]